MPRRYGWVRDLPDKRDLVYASGWNADLPARVPRMLAMPAIYDQGGLQSCTGNATARVLQYCRRMQGLTDYVPSRLMLYWNARTYEGTTSVDAGAGVRDVIKGAGEYGACPETEWPYVDNQVCVAPSAQAFTAGSTDMAISYRRVNQGLDPIRACLASADPIIFGFSVYESFESSGAFPDGIAPMPGSNETMLGGHCVVAVGYDNNKGAVLCDNSWGPDWNGNGSFYLPYAYITNPNLASDLWTIRLVTEPATGVA